MIAILVVIVMMLFGLLHSVLAGRGSKNLMRDVFGDRLYEGFYRLGYNAFAVLLLLPVGAILVLNPGATLW
ncbi:MAG: hypothetical protein GYB67_06325, partial [Chloroflexi bacterium]|nr:hypothetical protein [Chloroflexota bacterium]